MMLFIFFDIFIYVDFFFIFELSNMWSWIFSNIVVYFSIFFFFDGDIRIDKYGWF